MKCNILIQVLALAASISASPASSKSCPLPHPDPTAAGANSAPSAGEGWFNPDQNGSGGVPHPPPGSFADQKGHNPLGMATRTLDPVSTYGDISWPTGLSFDIPANEPADVSDNQEQTSGDRSQSTSDDAKKNSDLEHGPEHRGHWLTDFDINTPADSWPDTGVTRKYTLTVQNKTMSPVGVPKQMLVINGQYPGPLIEANWGDKLEITVVNELENNGTGIHWHGLRQGGTNCGDGVGGITECPIAPGHSKVYQFQATSYGTTWYHSHFSAQYGDGVLGPIIIHGPASANYDIDLGHVIVNDYYERTAFQEDYIVHRNGPGSAANYLLNGKNIQPDGSSGERQQWAFQKGKKHLLRFINTSIDMMFKIQIDEHDLMIISNDFVPIQPYTVKELTIGIGKLICGHLTDRDANDSS